MALFSRKSSKKNKRHPEPDTHNRAGGQAYSLSPRLELVSLLTTSLVADRFYSKAGDDVKRLDGLLTKLRRTGDTEFAAKAAIYARKEHGLRSITHAVGGLLGRHASGSPWARSFFERIVHRPDDMCEILAFYWLRYGQGGRVPNAMKRGFAKVLGDLDAYQVAKYKGGQRSVSLVDVVNLCHPKSTPALSALVAGTLQSADTWESALSSAGREAAGDTDAALRMKAEAWTRLLADGKLGYFAALRNVRNIVAQAPDAIPALVSLLTNEAKVRKSLVLPFQIAKGIEAVQESGAGGHRRVVEALHTALDISLGNVPHLPGRTLVALDTSGSMYGQPLDIGALFAAVLMKSQSDVEVMSFSDRAKYLHMSVRGSAYSIAESIKAKCICGGTNFHTVFQSARGRYDRIIVLSDMQAWVGYYSPAKSVADYKRREQADPYIYTWDLAHYGTAQFPEAKACALAGWTDKVFDIMRQVESDPHALVAAVDAIDL